jgi:phosphatidate cytidylyltransferase
MAKDKINNIRNFTKKTYHFFSKLAEKITAYIHSSDPRDNSKQRLVSALILIPVALYAIFFSESAFIFLSIAVTILMTSEWIEITRGVTNQKKWHIIGFFYILIPLYCAIKIRLLDNGILFWMFSIIWATDICAFFAGKSLGGSKLLPKISPNKTWSGLAAGLIASILIGIISSFMFKGGILFFIFVSAILSLIEQAGDLFESKIKRIFGVKDSGNIIPGHGGVLDRLDGMMFVAPIVLVLITLFSDKF